LPCRRSWVRVPSSAPRKAPLRRGFSLARLETKPDYCKRFCKRMERKEKRSVRKRDLAQLCKAVDEVLALVRERLQGTSPAVRDWNDRPLIETVARGYRCLGRISRSATGGGSRTTTNVGARTTSGTISINRPNSSSTARTAPSASSATPEHRTLTSKPSLGFRPQRVEPA
jgi:hypothetical protein